MPELLLKRQFAWDRVSRNRAPGRQQLASPKNYIFHMLQGAERLEQSKAARASCAQRDPAIALLELQNHFYLHLATIRESVFDALMAGGYYEHRPDRVRLVNAAKGLVVGFLMVVAGGFLGAATGTAPWPWILTGTLTGAIILASGRLQSARTIAGARTLAKVLGFKDFLERVEKDHIERLERTPELFEK